MSSLIIPEYLKNTKETLIPNVGESMNDVLHYTHDAFEHLGSMFQKEGLALLKYMLANAKGIRNPPSDFFQEDTTKIFTLIPGFFSGNGTLKLIGNTLKQYGSVVYAPDFPYMNMGPIEEKMELISQKIFQIIRKYPNKELVLIGHSMGGLIAEELARIIYTQTGRKVHEIITIGTPHGKPEIVRLVQGFIPSGAYIGDLGHREHTNNLDAIMETTKIFSPQITMKDGLVDPEKQVPRGSERLNVIQFESKYVIHGDNQGQVSKHRWANHTEITGSEKFAASLGHNNI